MLVLNNTPFVHARVYLQYLKSALPEHMTSHYTWRSVTTLNDFGGNLGQPLETLFWALTISWSRLLAHVWSGPKLLSCLVTDEPVEFEKELVEVHQVLRKRTDHFRGISRINLKLMKENRNMSMCSRLDLKTRGSEPIMPKNRCYVQKL